MYSIIDMAQEKQASNTILAVGPMPNAARSETSSIALQAASVESTQRLRGAVGVPSGRFESRVLEALDDGWHLQEDLPATLQTSVTEERARSILSRNTSPDVPFELSINPYRGCEHGCVYCYARPSHAYLELSPGLDFESKLYAKTNAVELLRAELSRPGYFPSPIALGANTDCYQPVERKYRLTRNIISLLANCDHPLTIVTKSALIERDLDLLAPMAEKNLVKAFVSIGTLDRGLARRLEPRAASPQRRLDTLRALSAAKIPCGVLVAPVIPALSDKSVEEVLEAARAAGASTAAYILMRLPYELKEVFRDWLDANYPMRAAHVMSLVQQMRGGRDNDPRFGARMTGTGLFAQLLAQRFSIACRRLGLNGRDHAGREPSPLDCSLFKPPSQSGQMRLF